MTKKDYIAFASLFSSYRPEGNLDDERPAIGVYACPEVLAICKGTARIFQNDNGRFDRDRYLAACGVRKEDR